VLRAADPSGQVPIIVSSAWRHTQRLDDIKRHFPEDIRQRIVGVTPQLADADATSIHSDSSLRGVVAGKHKRQCEIVAWISRNAPDGRWLALDDRASGFEPHCPHLFLVPGTTINGGGPGITTDVAIEFRTRLEKFLQRPVGCRPHNQTSHASDTSADLRGAMTDRSA
jgi:HAD domain in Swiss Army Knife RNA repair proteins